VTAPLRAGIIGTGAIAAFHAEALAADPGAELVGVVDASRASAEAFSARWGAAVHDDLPALLEGGIDVLHVCTPPGVHAEQAIAALDRGVHVIVEKPPARSLAELDAMVEAARGYDRELAVVFQQRTGTAAAHVKRLLDTGALGRPLLAVCHTLWFRDQGYFDVPWRGSWATEGGGPTLGHGIHQLDLLAWLLGDAEEVAGVLWRLGRETGTEDSSTATIAFANGVVASVLTSAVAPRETSSIRLDTEFATVTVDHLYGHGHENWRITPAPGVPQGVIDSWRFPEREERSGHVPLVREVYAALREGRPLPSTASDPARSFELVAAISLSAARGRPVTLAEVRADAGIRRSFEAPVIDRRAT
jgi:predicted dehydrogenase